MKPSLPRLIGSLGGPLLIGVLLGSCVRAATPTFFIPPTEAAQLQAGRSQTPASTLASDSPAAATAAAAVVMPTATPPCTNGLTYENDLTIPDGTNVAPGQPIDKQWQVRNSGSCSWDQRYRLKLLSGDAMGVSPLVPLYPARPGTEATLEIHFTAPQAPGLYECHWQAVDPDGQAFGDPFYMQISVAP